MKTYTEEKTNDKDLFRLVDRNGNWTHYFHKPSKSYLRSVNYVLESGYAKGQRFYEWLKNKSADEADEILRRAGDRGDAIHSFIRLIFDTKGKVSRQDKVLAENNLDYRILTNDEWDAILSFQSFWKAHTPKLIANEMAVYNLKEGYAGTLDAIIRITKECAVKSCPCKGLAGKIGIYDWKSGGGIYGSYGAQLAAYGVSESLRGYLRANKAEYTAVLRLGTNHKTTGGYQFEVYNKAETNTHYAEFLAAKTIADADYEPFDPVKEIYDIPDTLDLVIETEELKLKDKNEKSNKKIRSAKKSDIGKPKRIGQQKDKPNK